LLLVVDNGSVYTKSLLDFLLHKKITFNTLPFDKVILSELHKYSSIILSGRTTNIALMNAINSKIIRHTVMAKTPLLGICYGAEILALTLGGTIKKMDKLNNGIQEIEVIKPNPICENKIRVFESHSYLVSKLDSCFEHIAKSDYCKYEIFQYTNHKIFGTQFHPEMSDDGKLLLEKFITIQ
jgi:GMP synthase (glutamine-hydrolysing)